MMLASVGREWEWKEAESAHGEYDESTSRVRACYLSNFADLICRREVFRKSSNHQYQWVV